VRSRWTPNDRLALVEALAARRGADSASFFATHGLASVYDRPGRGGSKKSKINLALLAVERRGDIDNVLDQARHLEEDHATTDLEIENGAMTLTGRTIQGIFPKRRYIFISHASADKPLADLLRDTLVLGGVPAEVLFYSAARGGLCKTPIIPSQELVKDHCPEGWRHAA
jgi:hypothetical protein